MSDRTSDRRISLWEKFKDKVYRDSFVASHLANNIAAQIFGTRELRGLTQKELADKAGMAQARISVMEDTSYENFSVKTLKRLASALDVALVVRFVPFSELTDFATNITPDRIAVREFKNDSLAPLEPFASQDAEFWQCSEGLDLAALPAGQPVVPGVQRPQTRASCIAGLAQAFAAVLARQNVDRFMTPHHWEGVSFQQTNIIPRINSPFQHGPMVAQAVQTPEIE